MLEKARGSGQDLTKAQLITAMFLADKGHLDADARPVFFDNYIATEKGPAGVAASEMLDAKYDWADTVDGKAPWSIKKTPGSLFVRPMRAANRRRLSISDQEAICKGQLHHMLGKSLVPCLSTISVHASQRSMRSRSHK